MKKTVLFVLFMPSLLASTTHSTPARAKKDYFEHYPPKEQPSNHKDKPRNYKRWQKRANEQPTLHKVILMSDATQYWKSRLKGDSEVMNRLFRCYTVPVNHHPKDASNTQYYFLF